MATAIRNVLILGGAGALGPALIKALLEAGKFKVYVVSRSSSNSTFPPQVNVIKSDFSPESLVAAFKGKDAVVDLIGHGTLEDRKKHVDVAVEAGVRRFIPSEFSGNHENKNNAALLQRFKDRVTIREYLEEKLAANPFFSWTSVSTGPFYDWSFEHNFHGFNLQEKTALIYDDGNQPFSTTTVSTVAKAVTAIFSKPAETANKPIYVASFTPTQNQILAVLEETTGEKWTVTKTTTAESLKVGQEKVQKGDLQGLSNLVLVAIYGPQYGSDFERNATLSNELLGLPKEDFKAVTKAIVEGKEV